MFICGNSSSLNGSKQLFENLKSKQLQNSLLSQGLTVNHALATTGGCLEGVDYLATVVFALIVATGWCLVKVGLVAS